jgi:Holliday junction DNA helicase RuvB
MTSKKKLPLAEMQNENAPQQQDNLLRPKILKEYIGQSAIKSRLEVFMKAARGRGGVLDHVLLSGPPGLGKTTLAHIVAHEMKGQLHVTSGPTLARPMDLLSLLSNIQRGDVLFIDEIHRLSTHVEEALYPAIEDFQIQVILGEGASAQAVTLPVQPFTLVGATTQAGKLSGPLRDRFGIHLNLDFYDLPDMQKILLRSARLLSIDLTPEALAAIARRSRGTPRIANRLLSRVRDFVEILDKGDEGLSEIAKELVKKASSAREQSEAVQAALDFLEVDEKGLQPLDRAYLRVLIENFGGGPAGVEALAASLSEDRRTLEEVVEPFLLKEAFIVRTPRGRQACAKSFEHLGLPLSGQVQTEFSL